MSAATVVVAGGVASYLRDRNLRDKAMTNRANTNT